MPATGTVANQRVVPDRVKPNAFGRVLEVPSLNIGSQNPLF
jgi:hypothetical protein